MSLLRIVGILILVLSVPAFAQAQDSEFSKSEICNAPDRTEEVSYICKIFDENSEWYIEQLDQYRSAEAAIQQTEVEGYRKAAASYYDSVSRRNEISAKAFEKQQSIGGRLEFLTYAVIFIAMVFIGAQLYLALKVDQASLETELEATGKSFKLRTQVIGLVVLFVSITFLYMFYYFVYTIDPLETKRPDEVALKTDSHLALATDRAQDMTAARYM